MKSRFVTFGKHNSGYEISFAVVGVERLAVRAFFRSGGEGKGVNTAGIDTQGLHVRRG